jgi:Cdc6-like AAA superfamily ATPase
VPFIKLLGRIVSARERRREREQQLQSPNIAMATAASDAARLHALIARWPQRADLISRLDKLLALPRIPDVLVYGPACTGKTSVVR